MAQARDDLSTRRRGLGITVGEGCFSGSALRSEVEVVTPVADAPCRIPPREPESAARTMPRGYRVDDCN